MNKLLTIIVLFLFLIPILLSGNKYFVGGDDGGLYYLNPKEHIKNFAINIVSDNTVAGASMGYNSVSYYLPFLIFIYILKQIPMINTQGVMYGLNLSMGFLFFYLFLGLWLKGMSKKTFVIKVISSLCYIFSPFILGTSYYNQYLAIYLVSVLPATFYFILKGINENKFTFSLIGILIFSVFSNHLLTFPWWSAFALTAMPLIIIVFLKKPKLFLKHLLYSITVFTFLNFYWIFHLLYAPISSNNGQSTLEFYSSSELASENLRIAKGVSETYNPLNVIFQTMSSNNPGEWAFVEYIGIFSILIILVAGLHLYRGTSMELRKVYFLGLSSFLISWFLFSPNIGQWGPNIFSVLVDKVPFFGAFRNMYDKFSLPLAFFYAFSLAVSMTIIVSNFKNIFKILLPIFVVLISIWAGQYMSLYNNNPYVKVRRISGQFNPNYLDLVNYLKESEDESRILWLPLNSPTYTYIEDVMDKDVYYSGISPMRVLANKTDFAGRFSFILPGDFFAGDKLLFQDLPTENYSKVGKIFQDLNLKYIIVDHRDLPENIDNYYYDSDRKISNVQNENFYNFILGDKLMDFGNDFSLFKIKSSFDSEKLFIDPVLENVGVNSKLSYKKVSGSKYLLTIDYVNSDFELFFKEIYDDRWKLYISDNGVDLGAPSVIREGVTTKYGMKWLVDVSKMKTNGTSLYIDRTQSNKLDLIVYFEPEKYNKLLYVFSGITFLVSLVYLITNRYWNGKKF